MTYYGIVYLKHIILLTSVTPINLIMNKNEGSAWLGESAFKPTRSFTGFNPLSPVPPQDCLMTGKLASTRARNARKRGEMYMETTDFL